jgi:hypothetical protein
MNGCVQGVIIKESTSHSKVKRYTKHKEEINKNV